MRTFERYAIDVKPFEEKYDLVDTPVAKAPGAVSLSPWDTVTFFQAVNAKTGAALVGVWVDGEGDKRLLLAVARVVALVNPAAEDGTAPAPAPGPPSAAGDAFLVADPGDAMKGVAAAAVSFPKIGVKPGRARGMVKDAAGRPVVGAHVRAWSSAFGGFKSGTGGVTDANGQYDFPLPTGICRVSGAEAAVRYNGRTLSLPLHPADGELDDFDSKTGHV